MSNEIICKGQSKSFASLFDKKKIQSHSIVNNNNTSKNTQFSSEYNDNSSKNHIGNENFSLFNNRTPFPVESTDNSSLKNKENNKPNYSIPTNNSLTTKTTPITSSSISQGEFDTNDTSSYKYFVSKKNEQKFLPEKYDKNSLTHIISTMVDTIEERSRNKFHGNLGLDDHKFENFQFKFNRVYFSWKLLINKIIELVNDIDAKYKKYKYFGLYEQLINTFLNIIVSYIIIGPNNNSKLDINAPNLISRTEMDPYKYTTSNFVIEKKIEIFLHNLPIKLELICEFHKAIKELGENYLILIKLRDKTILDIENLNKIIKTQTIDSKKEQNVEFKKVIQQNLEENKKIIRDKKKLLNDTNNKINKILDEKNKSTNSIIFAVSQTFEIIDFNYFMYDDWYPYLDYKLVQK